ncbi:hypothetical protein M409DRAFT_57060 [Zasmidium cellare ATCC 36951]|uniref:Zn(2)-C6 fungal-type domain-containing protein n=1 Tax=Zasmidium cellare ATCC 36951 TaxID=1080233 RepID=A0A6A6CAA8_ZASCE|nr:uncharacterized protein M409DRAFT_57060 [Zasmidium cellare ATCC 36951]KAF2163955.1 hypothetical protein M409DRAFT_57060 [Zasmidium cellare ATCC 36951]
MPPSHETSEVAGIAREDEPPPAKRQKVTAACDECRAKKIKCDSRREVCGPCQRTGSSCHWGIRKKRSAGVSKQELSRLKIRVEELETAAAKSAGVENAQAFPPTSPAGPPESSLAGEDAAETPAMMGLAADGASPLGPRQQVHNGYSNFRTVSFVNQLLTAIDGSSTPVKPRSAPLSRSRSSSVWTKEPKEGPRDHILPNRSRADHLLAVYWRLVHTLYPFLDADEIESRYRKVWTGEDSGADSTTFLCLLNIIFSLGCHFDSTTAPETRSENAAVFFGRAQELLSLQSLRYPSLLTVQCYLLMGQFLQSSNDPQLCWIVVGIAIRLAQSLGLDLERANARDCKSQVARCVWHGCVMMDRTLSTVFGRPSIITPREAASVPLPEAHDRGIACNCTTMPCSKEEGQSAMHFFIESLKLFELTSKPLEAFHDQAAPREKTSINMTPWPPACIEPKVLAAVLDVDKATWSWVNGLPLHLRRDSTVVRSAVHVRQTNILFLRHRLFRILLFRPILARTCHALQDGQAPESLEDGLALEITLQCAVSCVRSALEVISFFDESIAAHDFAELDEVLSSWWYNIFYLYTAATVLVAGRLHPSIETHLSRTVVDQALRNSMRLLNHFSGFSSHAAKAARIVALLLEKATRQRQRGSGAPSGVKSTHCEGDGQRAAGSSSSTTAHFEATARGLRHVRGESDDTGLETTRGVQGQVVGNDNPGEAGPQILADSFGVGFDLWQLDDDFSNMAWLTGFPSEFGTW